MTCLQIQDTVSIYLNTIGGLQHLDFVTSEIDNVVNQELPLIVEKIIQKKDKKDKEQLISNIEQKLLNELLAVKYTENPNKVGNFYVIDLIDNIQGNVIQVTGDVLDLSCKNNTKVIEANSYYEAKTSVKYKNIWFEKCDFLHTDTDLDLIGNVAKIKFKTETFIEKSSEVFKYFVNSYNVETHFLQLNVKGILKNVKVEYIANVSTKKIDCCNGNTLNFTDDVTTYILEKVIKKMSIISEQNQNKINNLIQ